MAGQFPGGVTKDSLCRDIERQDDSGTVSGDYSLTGMIEDRFETQLTIEYVLLLIQEAAMHQPKVFRETIQLEYVCVDLQVDMGIASRNPGRKVAQGRNWPKKSAPEEYRHEHAEENVADGNERGESVSGIDLFLHRYFVVTQPQETEWPSVYVTEQSRSNEVDLVAVPAEVEVLLEHEVAIGPCQVCIRALVFKIDELRIDYVSTDLRLVEEIGATLQVFFFYSGLQQFGVKKGVVANLVNKLRFEAAFYNQQDPIEKQRRQYEMDQNHAQYQPACNA